MALGDWLAAALSFLGPAGLLAAMFLVFAVDAAVFPALPELFAILFFSIDPTFGWGVLVLLSAIAGELAGNYGLYVLIRRVVVEKGRLPKRIDKVARSYMKFFAVRDERIILVNRIAPVVPFMGAFIAILGWNIRRCLAYLVAGGVVKYSVLLVLVGAFHLSYSRDAATLITIGAIVVLVAVSTGASYAYRRRAGMRKQG